MSYDSLLAAGAERVELNEFEAAVPFLREAYSLAEEINDTSLILDSGIKLGTAILRSGDYQTGQDHYLDLKEGYYSSAPPSIQATINNQIAWSYDFLGQYTTAIEIYKEALTLNKSTGDSTGIGRTSRNIANDLLFVGDYEEALSYAKQAVQYIPKRDSSQLSYSYQTVYVTYLFLGLTSEAAPYLLKACEMGEELNNRSLLNDCYFYLGDYYAGQNNLNNALNYYQKGLELAQEVNDLLNIARYYKYLGITYLNAEEPVLALSYFNRSLDYYESVGNEVLAAEIRSRIASCYRKTGDYDGAETLLLDALEFYTGGDYPYLEGSMLLALADLKIETGKEEEALQYLQRSNEVGEMNDEFWVVENTQIRYLNLNDSLFSSDEKLNLSKRIYESALSLPPDRQLMSLINLSKAYHNIGSDSAFYYAEKSFEQIEKKRLSFSGGSLKAGVFSDYASFYNEVGSWYAAIKKDYSRAFDLIEAAKARALLDQLAEANDEEFLQLNDATQIELIDLQKNIDQLYRTKRETTDPADLQQITEEISDAQFQYDARLEEIRREHPAWNTYLYPETLSLKEVQELCDDETAIIEYAFTEDHLMIFVITSDQVHYFESSIQEDIKSELTILINDYRQALVDQHELPKLSDLSAPLYSNLVYPVSDIISSYQNLVIVPDAILSLLPFEALLNNERFLIQDHAVKYLPSVSVFDMIQSPHRSTQIPLLALAGSGFDSGNSGSNSISRRSFAPLPYTLIEVDSIASDFNQSTVLKDHQVTETTLKSMDLTGYKYLHFATHGNIDELSPGQSGLILNDYQNTEMMLDQDGYLNASEISQLDLNADMVVLSACNTALGKALNGEGLLGLQRSFLAAGASSVVSSLWSIYDRSTSHFMDSFYTKLVEDEEQEIGIFAKLLIMTRLYEPELIDYKTLALRDAKLEMLDHPYYSHPVHWASFVITGK